MDCWQPSCDGVRECPRCPTNERLDSTTDTEKERVRERQRDRESPGAYQLPQWQQKARLERIGMGANQRKTRRPPWPWTRARERPRRSLEAPCQPTLAPRAPAKEVHTLAHFVLSNRARCPPDTPKGVGERGGYHYRGSRMGQKKEKSKKMSGPGLTAGTATGTGTGTGSWLRGDGAHLPAQGAENRVLQPRPLTQPVYVSRPWLTKQVHYARYQTLYSGAEVAFP